jgi:hypothetical protein
LSVAKAGIIAIMPPISLPESIVVLRSSAIGRHDSPQRMGRKAAAVHATSEFGWIYRLGRTIMGAGLQER